MPAQRPRASFEPISPDFDVKALVESTTNFSYVDRINCDMIDQQGQAAFEKLVLLHVVIGGKPLVVDGFEERLDPWAFRPQWLRDNCGEKVENARNLTAKENLPLTMAHYLRNMGILANQFFDKPGAYRDKSKQRVYLKDIDCPPVWWDKLKEQLPISVTYLNESTGDIGGPGAVPDANSNAPGQRLGKGIARAGDLMSSLPPDMRAENLMCYIGHEGTYTPAHREMCASLGNNIMVEASGTVSDDGTKAEKPGSSIWFMTESKDRHLVSEYWLSVLGHDIEVEDHFAQVVAWKKAPFNVYVVEQRPGDLILIPPLAPHQVWNRGTRTMKVAWNRTTIETLEMALNEAIPRSRIVCRDEQYKNKAIIYYTLQKYSSLLSLVQQQAARMPTQALHELMNNSKTKGLKKDFKRLFALYRQILLSEMFSPEDRDAPKTLEYLPFDSNVTCAYCRGNIFNRFLSCPTCKEVLGHQTDEGEGDPYDVCMDCYAMGRSCGCISGLKWVEQFRWKELTTKYETWRKLIVALDGGQLTEKTPLPLLEERKRYGKKTLAEVCKDQLKRRPWKDISKPANSTKKDDESDEEIVVDDNGMVKKVTKKRSKAWLKSNQPCHVCCHRHPTWKMAQCTTCVRWWCYGSLFRGWDKMPLDIMQDPDFSCPHCLGICFAGACKREGKMNPYEPKGTLLGHDTKKVADVRSVEALVDFSISNLTWLRDDDPANKTDSRRFRRATDEAQKNKALEPSLDADDDVAEETQLGMEYSPVQDTSIDPALGGNPSHGNTIHRDSDFEMSGALQDEEDVDSMLARQLQAANSSIPPPAAVMGGTSTDGAPEGYAPLASSYPQPDDRGDYLYPGYSREDRSTEPPNGESLRPFLNKRRRNQIDPDMDEDLDDITMQKGPRVKKPRLTGAGFRSTDLAEDAVGVSASKTKNEAQRQFEKEKERKALEKAKHEGRFIMLQAAIKGKKRVVRLKIPGARLAQILAQQAAKVALEGGDIIDIDAEHEVVEPNLQPRDADEDEMDALLKSDIPQTKPAKSTDQYYQRIKDGKIVTGSSKKVLIPVEKDDTYGYTYREKLPNGKRIQRTINSLPATAASTKGKRDRRPGRAYEEVDVGSDQDDEFTNDDIVPTDDAPMLAHRERRALPAYLQDRHTGDSDLPDELPDDFRDTQPPRLAKQPAFSAEPAQISATEPGLQAAISTPRTEPGSTHESEEAQNAMDVVDAVANGAFLATPTNSDIRRSTLGGVRPSRGRPSRGRPRGRPSRPLGPKPGAQVAAAAEMQKTMAEENRLAKLQALQLVGDTLSLPGPKRGRGAPASRGGRTSNMADPLVISDASESEDEDEDDDLPDAVPARA